jgi:hypothetical protein
MDLGTLCGNHICHYCNTQRVDLLSIFTRKEIDMEQQKPTQELTPMQEFIQHLKSNFGYISIDDSIWLNKEKSKIVTAYNEGVEDGGFFGNGSDYFERNF